MHTLALRTSLIGGLCAGLLAACDLDYGTKDAPKQTNLAIKSISTDVSKSYTAGSVINIEYEINIENADDIEVKVNLFAVHNEDDTQSDVEQEVDDAHYMYTDTHQHLSSGVHRFNVQTTIPNAIEHDGEFILLAHVDPDNSITESDETDNVPHLDDENQSLLQEYPSAVIQLEAHPEHDFLIKSVSISNNLVMLDTPESHVGTGEEHPDVIGHMDAIYHGNVPIDSELDVEVLINGNWQSVRVWDAEQQAYSHDNLAIEFTHNDYEHFFGFDLAFTTEQLTELYASYDAAADNTLSLRFTLHDITDKGVEHSDENNSLVQEVPLFFFDASNDTTKNSVQTRAFTNKGNTLAIDGSFNANYGDASKFAVAVDLAGEMTLDLLAQGAVVEATGDVNMWIFNAQNTIFGVSFDGSAYSNGLNTGYNAEMTFLNAKVYEDSWYNAQFEKTFEKSWERRVVLASAKFFAGPIPISIEAGIDGSVGFELTLGYNSKLYAAGDIFSADFGAFANGGVDLALLKTGITVDLNILNNVLNLDSSANLALLSDGNLDPQIEYDFNLTDSLDVISGKFGLFAEVEGVKWCKKWGIRYPCGVKSTTYYLWLYQTPSVFKKDWTLYSNSGSFGL